MAAKHRAPTGDGKRQRFQLVVHLGEWSRGAEVRAALEKAASLCHQELGTWSRRVLLAAAGMQDQQFVTRADLLEWDRQQSERVRELRCRVEALEQVNSPSRSDMERLIERLEAVEKKAGIDSFLLLEPSERSRRSR